MSNSLCHNFCLKPFHRFDKASHSIPMFYSKQYYQQSHTKLKKIYKFFGHNFISENFIVSNLVFSSFFSYIFWYVVIFRDGLQLLLPYSPTLVGLDFFCFALDTFFFNFFFYNFCSFSFTFNKSLNIFPYETIRLQFAWMEREREWVSERMKEWMCGSIVFIVVADGNCAMNCH